MKRCSRCKREYSDAWNICILCDTPLIKEPSIKSLFTRPRPYDSVAIENAIDNSGTIFLYLNKDLDPVLCNKALEDITGYSREEIFKGDWLGLLFQDRPSRKEIFKSVIISCLTTRRPHTYISAITKKDGNEGILYWKNAAVADDSGNICGIVCTAHDITEDKTSEDGMVAQYEHLRSIFASIKDYALITTNLEGNITYYGIGSAELFGWKSDMAFQNISVIFPETDRDMLESRIRGSISACGRFEEEVALLREGKETFPAILAVTALLDNKNRPAGYVYIARDITERKKMEKQIVDAEKLAAIGQLAAGVAHEINNPLVVIAGRLELLEMEGKKIPPEVKKVLDTIKSQAQRMRVITDRLLLYSRRRPPRMDIIKVNDILKTLSPLLIYNPEFKKVKWKEELARDLSTVKGDFNQLQEIFLNIALNACQAMPEGGTLTIGSRDAEDGFIEVIIKDTGVGIKKEDIDKIFMPFFTTKDNGTGLGLSVCQHIIHSHGGSIEVESEVGRGSTFIVRLPISKE